MNARGATLQVARALVALLLALALWVWVHRARVKDATRDAMRVSVSDAPHAPLAKRA